MNKAFWGAKAIIFDMDGVLFLSSACHAAAYRDTLAPVGVTGFSYDRVAGMRTDEAMRQLLAEKGGSVDEALVQKLTHEKRERAIALLEVEGQVANGSAELIRALRSQYKLGLASSGSLQVVTLFLGKSGYADAFAVTLHGESVQSAKPAPDIYLLAARELGLMPNQCVVVEDALSGVIAAKSAGMAVVAVTEGEAEPFLRHGAAVVVSGLEEIPALLT